LTTCETRIKNGLRKIGHNPFDIRIIEIYSIMDMLSKFIKNFIIFTLFNESENSDG
jgi:hypothetical protein